MPRLLQNYTRAWTEAKICITLPNSVIVTATSVLGSMLLSALPAYGLSEHERPLAMAFYLLFVGGVFVLDR